METFSPGHLKGAAFINSTDNGESWVEINHDDITVDVRALAINANGHIFAGTYAGGTSGGIFRSTDDGDSWTPVNNGLGCGTLASLAITKWLGAHPFDFAPASGQLRRGEQGGL